MSRDILLILGIGETKDAEDVSGSITIPEVAHDTEEDEYVVRSLAFFSPSLCLTLVVLLVRYRRLQS